MGSKHFVFNWLIISNALMFIISYPGAAQGIFDRYQSFILGIDSSIDIGNYDKTYIVHFNYCTSPKYCGNNLINYIEKNKNKRILILCDDPKNNYLKKLKNNSYHLFQVDFTQLDRNGLFSVYNIEINKKQKVKKLI